MARKSDLAGWERLKPPLLLPQLPGVLGDNADLFSSSYRMIFAEIQAEMKRPRDFIKGMALAQLVIIVCYLVYVLSALFRRPLGTYSRSLHRYGCVIYGLQGQYTLPLAYQGVSKYS